MALGCWESASRHLSLAWGCPIIGVDIGAITAIVAAYMDGFAMRATARPPMTSTTSRDVEAERQQYETHHNANRSPLSHGPFLLAVFGMMSSSLHRVSVAEMLRRNTRMCA